MDGSAPEVLQWARSTLDGITHLEYKARWEGLDVDPSVWEMLGPIEQRLIEFLESHKTTDPTKWVSDLRYERFANRSAKRS